MSLALAGAAESAPPSVAVEVNEPIASVEMKSIEGEVVDPAAFPGRFVLIMFSGEDSKEEAKRLSRAHARGFAGLEDFVILNVIYPGSSAELTSRATIIRRIRREFQRESDAIRDTLPESLRPGFDAIEGHEVIDWEGDFTRGFGAPMNRIGLILIGPRGRVIRSDSDVNDAVLRGVIRTVRVGAQAYLRSLGRSERIEKFIEKIEQ